MRRTTAEPRGSCPRGSDSSRAAISLSPLRNGGILSIRPMDSWAKRYVASVHFSVSGAATPAQRVSYIAGASVSNPVGGSYDGVPYVLWQAEIDQGYRTSVVASSYRASVHPTPADLLGLNNGSTVWNVAFLIVGAFVGGAPLAVANALLVLGLDCAGRGFSLQGSARVGSRCHIFLG